MKARVSVRWVMSLVLALVGTGLNAAQALEGWWDDRFGFPDFNRTVYAVAVAPSGVYVGGAFGGNPQLMRLERMARWAAGHGPGSEVRARSTGQVTLCAR